MFKKLKDKIAEEVKSSPQRLQQFTQSVTEKIQHATSDESFFSLAEDEAPVSSSPYPEPGFSNVPLSSYSNPNSNDFRRNSNSSIASDMSFLPRYESSSNLYHLQSDLDVSASEVEDNASTSSQLGHLSKEQIYSAFQKAQMRYHKYRGRYTDITNHYRELERENGKIKSVLVETQDKALRRVAELREQCSLEQKAKAHLENALRLEIDEKQYVIDTLKTKINLLQSTTKNGEYNQSELLVNINDDEGAQDSVERNQNENEIILQELKGANLEIDNLKEKLQEMKANAIVFNSKEADFKNKISALQETIKQQSAEISHILEREKENNLKTAQTKMELHTEIQNRDLEIENLKHDMETLRLDVEQSEIRFKTGKLENLQNQNSKLIEKVESLTQKCNNYESELLKLETFRMEINNSRIRIKELEEEKSKLEQKLQEADKSPVNSEEIEKMKQSERALQTEICSLKYIHLTQDKQNEELLKQQKSEYDEKIAAYREDTKERLLTLESKIREKVKAEYDKQEEKLKLEFQNKIEQLSKTGSNIEDSALQLIKKEEVKHFVEEIDKLKEEIHKHNDKYSDLEINHLDLISENNSNLIKLSRIEKENCVINSSINNLQKDVTDLNNKLSLKEEELQKLNNEYLSNKTQEEQFKMLKDDYDRLQNENLNLQKLLNELHAKIVELNKSYSKLLDDNCRILKDNTVLSNLQKENETVIFDLKSSIDDVTKQNSQLHDSLNETKALIETYQIQIDKKEQEIQLIQQDSFQKSTTKENDLQILLEESQKTLETTRQTLEKKLKTQKVKFHNEIQALNKELAGYREKDQEVQSCIDEYRQKLSEYEAEILTKATQIEKIMNNNAELNEEIVNLKKSIDVFKTENLNLSKDLANREDELSQKIVETQGVHNKLSSVEEECSKEKATLNYEIQKITDECNNLKMQVLNMETEKTDMNQVREMQNVRIEELEAELARASVDEDMCKRLQNENSIFASDILELKDKTENLLIENRNLLEQTSKAGDLQKTNEDILNTNKELKDDIERYLQEILDLKKTNDEISLNYKQVSKENEGFLQDLAGLKIKCETLETSNLDKQAELEKQLEHYKNVQLLSSKQEKHVSFDDIQCLERENKSLINQLSQLEEHCKTYKIQNKSLEAQVRELEHQYIELSHERQLLKDEIQELKISPINVNNSSSNANKLDNLDILNPHSIENSNNVDRIREDHEKELFQLNEKLTQYKSLDLTNRSSIQFYEGELQKLRNKNEKLNRKLDETLVTLNHCSELTNSTETEYLKNVLYNYMLGKESLILARVIAAVCKFDDSQTEAVLQREQQKQTLLGQLGFV